MNSLVTNQAEAIHQWEALLPISGTSCFLAVSCVDVSIHAASPDACESVDLPHDARWTISMEKLQRMCEKKPVRLFLIDHSSPHSSLSAHQPFLQCIPYGVLHPDFPPGQTREQRRQRLCAYVSVFEEALRWRTQPDRTQLSLCVASRVSHPGREGAPRTQVSSLDGVGHDSVVVVEVRLRSTEGSACTHVADFRFPLHPEKDKPGEALQAFLKETSAFLHTVCRAQRTAISSSHAASQLRDALESKTHLSSAEELSTLHGFQAIVNSKKEKIMRLTSQIAELEKCREGRVRGTTDSKSDAADPTERSTRVGNTVARGQRNVKRKRDASADAQNPFSHSLGSRGSRASERVSEEDKYDTSDEDVPV